jgi:hypothetical protein
MVAGGVSVSIAEIAIHRMKSGIAERKRSVRHPFLTLRWH